MAVLETHRPFCVRIHYPRMEIRGFSYERSAGSADAERERREKKSVPDRSRFCFFGSCRFLCVARHDVFAVASAVPVGIAEVIF